jgi:hypothetical protein
MSDLTQAAIELKHPEKLISGADRVAGADIQTPATAIGVASNRRNGR